MGLIYSTELAIINIEHTCYNIIMTTEKVKCMCIAMSIFFHLYLKAAVLGRAVSLQPERISSMFVLLKVTWRPWGISLD